MQSSGSCARGGDQRVRPGRRVERAASKNPGRLQGAAGHRGPARHREPASGRLPPPPSWERPPLVSLPLDGLCGGRWPEVTASGPSTPGSRGPRRTSERRGGVSVTVGSSRAGRGENAGATAENHVVNTAATFARRRGTESTRGHLRPMTRDGHRDRKAAGGPGASNVLTVKPGNWGDE